MKVISITDLKLIPELKDYSYTQLINPEADELMAKYLGIIGFDVTRPIQYIPTQHRNMQKKIVINYMIVGEVRRDREYLTSEWADVTDRLVASSYTDRSLTRELLSLQNSSLDYSAFHEGKEDAEFSPADIGSYYNKDEERCILAEIRQLEEIRDSLRGSMYKKDGSAKTFEDYRSEAE